MILNVDQTDRHLYFYDRYDDCLFSICQQGADIILGKRALKAGVKKVRVTPSLVPSKHASRIRVTRRFIHADSNSLSGRTFFVLTLRSTLRLTLPVYYTKKLLKGVWPAVRKLGNEDSIKVYLTVEVLK